MTKALQHFTEEYLDDCRKMTPDQILLFLDDYRKLHYEPGKLVQINIRIPENILAACKAKAKKEGQLYQRVIKDLITNWVLD